MLRWQKVTALTLAQGYETGAMIQYSNTGASIGGVMVGLEEAKDTETTTAVYDENGKFLRNETDRARWLFNISFALLA